MTNQTHMNLRSRKNKINFLDPEGLPSGVNLNPLDLAHLASYDVLADDKPDSHKILKQKTKNQLSGPRGITLWSQS